MIYSELAEMSTAEARKTLAGLPRCDYDVVVKPLRYRTQPHLAALCDFDGRRITLQVPVPFHPFMERVYHGARRKRGKGMHFSWLSENVMFRSRRDVLVPARRAEEGLGCGDGMRPIRPAQFPQAARHDR